MRILNMEELKLVAGAYTDEELAQMYAAQLAEEDRLRLIALEQSGEGDRYCDFMGWGA